jgi:hypothetical protein
MTTAPSVLNLGTIRTATLPTTSYVYATIDTTGGQTYQTCARFNTLVLDIAFVKESATSFEILVEGSMDGTTYYPYTVGTFASSIDDVEKDVLTLTCSKYAASDSVSIPIQVNHSFLRVGVKGTGTLTDTTVAVSAHLFNA